MRCRALGPLPPLTGGDREAPGHHAGADICCFKVEDYSQRCLHIFEEFSVTRRLTGRTLPVMMRLPQC